MNRAEILQTAEKCVCGQREEDYGSPEDNFGVIANLWGDYKGVAFTPLDVSMMMALLKIARIRTGKATDDCFVDLAGYAACGGEIAAHKSDYAKELEGCPITRNPKIATDGVVHPGEMFGNFGYGKDGYSPAIRQQDERDFCGSGS